MKRHRAHYDVIVMESTDSNLNQKALQLIKDFVIIVSSGFGESGSCNKNLNLYRFSEQKINGVIHSTMIASYDNII